MEKIKVMYRRYISDTLIYLLRGKITANQLTVLNHIITLTFGVYGFSRGTWRGYLLGVTVMSINVILDYADGDLAKETGTTSEFGAWLDSGIDVIIQNAVMASIFIGCIKEGMPIAWGMAFMVMNAGMNMVSFHYNQRFGFSSSQGMKSFRDRMGFNRRYKNRHDKNLVDPTSSGIGLVLFTYRYWVLAGAILNLMPLCMLIVFILLAYRLIFMSGLYLYYLSGNQNRYVCKVLSCFDESRESYYGV